MRRQLDLHQDRLPLISAKKDIVQNKWRLIMMNKLFPLLIVLVLSACTTPDQTGDMRNSQKSSSCRYVKCECRHCNKDACDCAHDKAPDNGEIFGLKGAQ